MTHESDYTVSWEYGPAEQQHIRDANRADDRPDDLSLEVDDGAVTVEGSAETIRWLYDYLHYLKRAWRQEGEQWDADVAEEMAESLYDQVDGDLPERQRAKQAMTDGGTMEERDESELIEKCERCGGDLDANIPGHNKSPSEIFVHKICYEEGVPEEPVLDLTDEHPFMEQVPQQYNCGHYAEGPPSKLPAECPECGVPAP